jgi:hypothetical protein
LTGDLNDIGGFPRLDGEQKTSLLMPPLRKSGQSHPLHVSTNKQLTVRRKTPLCSLFGAACALALTAGSASATIIYSSDGSDISGYAARGITANGAGGTVASTQPFVINGVSQGSYISATNYPTKSFSSVTPLSTPDIWVAFLMRDDSGNAWAGGVTLFNAPTGTTSACTIGWNTHTEKIALYDGADANPSTQSAQLINGTPVAVLAHIYTDNNSTYDRADLYVDGNISDGISFGSAQVSGYQISSARSAIAALRLNADTVSGGETRSYDNIAVTTTQQEALDLISAVPEPGAWMSLLGGCGVLMGLRRRR